MSNYVTLQGFASSDVELDTKESGLVIGKFRMGSTHRVQDPATKVWGDGPTNWFRVNVFRSLAHNVAASVHKGDHIIVSGKLRIKTWLRLDGSQGMSVEIDAETVGNDLKFGTCTYHRNATPRTNAQAPYPQSQNGDGTSTPNPVTDPNGADGETGDRTGPGNFDEGDIPAVTADAASEGTDSETDGEDGRRDDGDMSDAQVDAGDGLLAYVSTGELVDSAGPPY